MAKKPEAAKTETPKKAAPKAAAKAAAPKKSTAGRTDGIHKPVKPSKELAAVVGADSLSRGDVVSKIWDYIKKNKLQNPADGREILADKTLEAIFGKPKVTMFEMNKLISGHLS